MRCCCVILVQFIRPAVWPAWCDDNCGVCAAYLADVIVINTSVLDVFRGLPILVLGYSNQTCVIPVFGEMKESIRNLRGFATAAAWNSLGTFIVYTAVGYVCSCMRMCAFLFTSLTVAPNLVSCSDIEVKGPLACMYTLHAFCPIGDASYWVRTICTVVPVRIRASTL